MSREGKEDTVEELKPCPFCGDDEELRVCQPAHMHGYWVVHCGCCAGEMQDETEGGAIAGWNTRPQSTVTEEMIEALGELVRIDEAYDIEMYIDEFDDSIADHHIWRGIVKSVREGLAALSKVSPLVPE